jgi:proline dehydrogenase
MSSDQATLGGDSMATKTGSVGKKKVKFGSLLSVALAPFARRFIAGITLSEALAYVERLSKQGFLFTLDHLGEDVESEGEAKNAAEHYVVMLRALNERHLERNVSLKLSQMGLSTDKGFCQRNLEMIVDAAHALGGFVRVDMEGSPTTDDTLDIVKAVKKNRAVPVGTVVQAMLKRTPDDVLSLLERDITIRLCKGAYKEPREIAHQRMPEIRAAFISMAKRLLTSGLYHGIATHDETIINAIKEFVRENRIEKGSFEFQMLLGIRPKLQKRLVSEGYRLRIYVPFGRSWLPYTLRRIRERKENLWFAIKGFFQP